MAVIPDVDLPGSGCKKSELYCARCGQLYFGRVQVYQNGESDLVPAKCVHMNTADPDITPAHAERIRARYAIGKRYNPDHDTTSYRDLPRP